MSDSDRIHRLMTGLARGAPPHPGRLGAVMGKAVAIRRRRRAVAASGAAVLAVVALSASLLVLGPDHRSSQQNLFTDDPTPTVTTDPSGTPTSAAEPTPTDAPATGTPNTPSSTPSPGVVPGPAVLVSVDSLLTTGYVEKAFGAGRSARVSTTTAALPGLIRSCFHLFGDEPRSFVARSWSWPGEVVFSEALSRERSPEATGDRYRACTDPSARAFDPDAVGYEGGAGPAKVWDVDLMDHGMGTIVVVERPFDTSVYASATLDDNVVIVLTWRQTGALGSEDAFTRAFVSAVRRATGGDEGAPVAAPPQQAPDALNGFLGTAALPHRLPWVHDARGPAGLNCGHTQVPTATPLVSRLWSATSTGAPEPTPGVTISFTTAADATTAASGFAACKQAWSETNDVNEPIGPGVGDESFWFAPDPLSTELVVRSGSAYLVVQYETGSYDDTIAIARDALAALGAAGRL